MNTHTKWTSELTNHEIAVHVRDDFLPGDRCSHYSWSIDGNRWYESVDIGLHYTYTLV